MEGVRGPVLPIWGFPKIKGTLFGGPNNKDYNILGSILGSPYFGKLPFRVYLDPPTWVPFLGKETDSHR